jgi:hypothetical protein
MVGCYSHHPDPAFHCEADPDPEPTFHFEVDRLLMKKRLGLMLLKRGRSFYKENEQFKKTFLSKKWI